VKPVLLDIYCGAGGAGAGYHRAGFRVIGIDIAPQPNYPFEFIQCDALGYLEVLAAMRYEHFDAIHASPPCQFYSAMSKCRPGLADGYPDLIGPTRELLHRIGLPYVIENVPLARDWMRDPIELCGTMFGYELYRHRLFESNFPLYAPLHPAHVKPASKAGHWRPGTIMSVAGHCAPVALAREIMDIDWTTRDELAEAIPPYYTSYVGGQLLEHLRLRASA
jgi:DNA (cytosine-5)-methyltransferase 1